MKRKKRIQLFENRAGCWHWHLVGGNGEIQSSSEAYARKSIARRAARDVYSVCDPEKVELVLG